MSFKELLGDTLLTKEGEKSTDILDGKVVGLYFSAHWCGPCRRFTPMLSEFYKKVKDAGKNFEIVFVSSDQDQEAFDGYYGEHPWLALPYTDRELKNKLSSKYKVAGIPTFVILDENAEQITKDGRSVVMTGSVEAFPWKPPTVREALGKELLKKGNEKVSVDEALKGKKVGLYFSAHWCPPCKMFTPMLVNTYNETKKEHPDFEIIFVSSDRDEEAFEGYFGEMPWLALPYENREAKDALSARFEVEGIPTFVMLDEDLNLLNRDARGAVMEDPSPKGFPWEPKAVNDLANPEGINENPALILLAGGAADDVKDSACKTFESFGEKKFASFKSKLEPDMLFFVSKSDDEGPVGQIRKLTKLADEKRLRVLYLDIPSGGGFYVSDMTEVTEDSLAKFLADIEAGTANRQQLG